MECPRQKRIRSTYELSERIVNYDKFAECFYYLKNLFCSESPTTIIIRGNKIGSGKKTVVQTVTNELKITLVELDSVA